MNRDDIIRMAREAAEGMEGFTPKVKDPSGAVLEFYERFAALVRKDYSNTHANLWLDRIHKFVLEEREACAKICEEHSTWTGRMCAETIKARGQA